MANGLINLIGKTRRIAGLSKARALSDRQLLEEFADGDETAFTTLVDRYGGLVMGVCQRLLQHTQDAEDAFQATFMVLARKAGKVAWQESVANWLHGVASRISFRIRREKSRRLPFFNGTGTDEPAIRSPDPIWGEWKPMLDEELNRLPDRYRIPLILCCLEGMSRDETAAKLGWSIGSLKGRLERGREILRGRLARRGLTLSAVFAAMLTSTTGAKAAVPLTLGLATARAGSLMLAGQTAGVVSTKVFTLAQGALHTMFIAKLKVAAAVALTVVTVGLGTGYVAHRALAINPAVAGAAREGQKTAISQKDEGPPDFDVGAAIDVPELSEFLDQPEGRAERKQSPSVNGIVQTIDAKSINILTSRRDIDGQTFELGKDVKVVLVEAREIKDAKLADVQPKTRVNLILDDAKKVVQSIQIIGARRAGGGERGVRDDTVFRGEVTEIDAAKKTITFVLRRRGEADDSKTFKLAKDVKVMKRSGRSVKEAKLADVPVKSWVQVKLDDSKKIVQSIEFAISTNAYGSVSALDASSITLVSGRDPEAKGQTFGLSKEVKVQFRFPFRGEGRGTGKVKAAKLADVALKSAVSVQLDDDRKVVQAIDIVVSTTTFGAVSAIDANSITLVSGREPETKSATYTLSKDVKIQYRLPIPGEARAAGEIKTLKLADLAVKSTVFLQLDDDLKAVESINVQLPTFRGKLEEVDAKKGTLQVSGPRATDLNLTASKELRVFINGKPGTLDKLAVGTELHLVLSPDRTQALLILTPIPEGRRRQ